MVIFRSKCYALKWPKVDLTIIWHQKCKENQFEFENCRNCRANILQFKSCSHDITCVKKKSTCLLCYTCPFWSIQPQISPLVFVCWRKSKISTGILFLNQPNISLITFKLIYIRNIWCFGKLDFYVSTGAPFF